MYWRKIIIFVFTVLLPAIIVGVSNLSVFPDSAWQATLMLVVTVGVAAVFTYFSAIATAKIARYCILADVAICAILCVNLGGHWILAREVSAAKQGVEERHAEEDRELGRKRAEAEIEIARKTAEAAATKEAAQLARDQARAANAERRRLATLPVDQRRSALKPVQAEPEATPAPAISPLAQIPVAAMVETPKAIIKRLTPDEVRAAWWWFLTFLAIAECAAAVLAGAILAGIWEWDRNRDGIPDHLQTPQYVTHAYIERGDEPGKLPRHRM